MKRNIGIKRIRFCFISTRKFMLEFDVQEFQTKGPPPFSPSRRGTGGENKGVCKFAATHT